ncbi:helix-turn-helix transcriptional regulator, partial [Rhodocaloribacter sp.]
MFHPLLETEKTAFLREVSTRDVSALPGDVRTLLGYLHAHLFDRDLTVTGALDACGLHSARIHACFRRHVGTTVHAYVERLRIEAAVRLMRREAGSLSDVAFAVGYENYSTFGRAFKRRT